MFETRITELLDVQYPIIQGGMVPVSEAELAAAVSNAGGLGIIASPNFPTPEELRDEIQKAKELTDKPIGVNISLFPAARPLPNEEYINVCIDEGIAVVESSGVKSPEEFVDQLREGDIKLIHKVAEVRHARKAEEIGADAVTIVGAECGGHPGLNDLTSMVLIPLVVDAVNVPVIAGGGISDGRGLVAALALGADAVIMGTRFMATEECKIHPKFKEKMLNAKENETGIVMRSIRMNTRVIENEAMKKVLKKEQELEQKGASFDETLEELLPLITGDLSRKTFHQGELDAGIASCGQAVGSIDEILSVKELIDGVMEEAEEVCENLSSLAR